MNVLVLGGSGLLGAHLGRELVEHGHRPLLRSTSTTPAIDLRQAEPTRRALDELGAEAVVYLAAVTDLERCEREPDLATAVHVDGAVVASTWASAAGVPFVYVSTDSVFDGERGSYREVDPVQPLNVYAATKARGEQEVLDRGHGVVRTNFLGPGRRSFARWLYDELSAGHEIQGYADVRFSPLAADEVASVLRQWVERPYAGILHVGSAGATTKEAVARAAQRHLGRGVVVTGALPDGAVRRPRDTSLDSSLVRSVFDVPDRGWERATVDAMMAMEEEGE